MFSRISQIAIAFMNRQIHNGIRNAKPFRLISVMPALLGTATKLCKSTHCIHNGQVEFDSARQLFAVGKALLTLDGIAFAVQLFLQCVHDSSASCCFVLGKLHTMQMRSAWRCNTGHETVRECKL